ncbi:MAG: MATE family efflux transporter [Flavobacteriales bacterium]|nr:MATE family efflux transporter [Flavobacteriales bacterium]
MKTGNSYLDILKMALPIFLGMLANTLVTIVDTAFMGRVGTPEQSAVGYAFMFFLVPAMISMGFSVGIQILVARRNGEGNFSQSGVILRHGLIFLSFFALLTIAFVLFLSDPLFRLVLSSDSLRILVVEYLKARTPGMLFSIMGFGFISYFVGLGNTYPITVSAILGGIVNIVFDYFLIFGKGGFPELGIQGAAYATALAECVTFISYAVFAYFILNPEKYGMRRFTFPQLSLFIQIVKVSGPLVIQHFISITSWFLFFTLIENTGERNLGMSIIIRSLYSVLIMPILAYGSATSSMVSNLIGQGREEDVYGLVKKILKMSVGTLLFLSVFLYLFLKPGLMLFTEDSSLAEEASRTDWILAAALVMMAFSYVMFSVISGTGKTMASLMVEASGLVIYIGYTFMVTVFYPQDITGIWFSEIVYMFFWGLFSVFYLWKWDKVLPKNFFSFPK